MKCPECGNLQLEYLGDNLYRCKQCEEIIGGECEKKKVRAHRSISNWSGFIKRLIGGGKND